MSKYVVLYSRYRSRERYDEATDRYVNEPVETFNFNDLSREAQLEIHDESEENAAIEKLRAFAEVAASMDGGAYSSRNNSREYIIGTVQIQGPMPIG